MKNVMNDLKETAALMVSPDYRERFRAEYWQTEIRYERLRNYCDRIEIANTSSDVSGDVLEPEHDCSYELLRKQQAAMGQYLHLLEMRAIIEGIDL